MDTQEMKTDQSARGDTEARVEALLAQVLAPHPPPESLRRQVRKQVATAWERRPLTVGQRVLVWLRAPLYQRAWAAVAALAVVAVVAALALPSEGVPVAGTMVGKTGAVVATLATGAIVAIVVAWLLRKHRH